MSDWWHGLCPHCGRRYDTGARQETRNVVRPFFNDYKERRELCPHCGEEVRPWERIYS